MDSTSFDVKVINQILLFVVGSIVAWQRPKAAQNWLNHGGDLHNRRYANKETKIIPTTVSKLRLKWKLFAGDDISATPAIFNGTLYFPSYNGNIYAVNACNGTLVWEKNLHELTGINATGFVPTLTYIVSRSTPTIVGDHDLLIVGIYGPAVVIAVKRSTGSLFGQHSLIIMPQEGLAQGIWGS